MYLCFLAPGYFPRQFGASAKFAVIGNAVIIGTGALSLGFLAEKISSDYTVAFCDISAKADLLKHLERKCSYEINVCHADRMEALRVEGEFSACNLDDEKAKHFFEKSLSRADLIFTAAGARNLPEVVARISPILNNSAKKCYLLFCENGRDLAKLNRNFFGDNVSLVDTVMSRMCRFAEPDETEYVPLYEKSQNRLVVESYSLIPLDKSVCSGEMFSDCFTMVDPEIFAAWEDIKFYAHNGVHAFISYHAFFEGVKRFTDVSRNLKKLSEKVMFDEIVPAIARAHPSFGEDEIRAYGENLIGRLFNPYLKDTVARGIRGVKDKLTPTERLVSGVRFISSQGIIPTLYASTVSAAIRFALQTGELSGSHEEIIRKHCYVTEPELIELMRRAKA